MKKIFLSLPVIIILQLGCAKTTDKNIEITGENATVENGKSITENPDSDQLIIQKMVDPKTGAIYSTIELPANWQINTKGAAMAESNYGVKLFYLPPHFYVNYQDQYMQQMFVQSGGKPRPFISIETIIDQDLMPIAKKENSKFVRQYDLPKVAEADRKLDALMYKAMPSKQEFRAVMTEWMDAKGNPYALIIHQNGSLSNGMMMWSYFCHALEAKPETYEKGKAAAIHGLETTLYNPKSFIAYNQQEANNARASWAAHNQKMQQNQTNFEAQQSAHVAKSEAINNSIMKNYNDKMASSDRNHNRFLNYIKDEKTVTNNRTGEKHQVETGGTEYWMNGDGRYIKSNDPNYDPNRNPETNNEEWDNTEIQN